MKEKLQFIVCVENVSGTFDISDPFDKYADAQKWRYEHEANFLKNKPTATSCHSNLIFRHIVEGAQ